LHEASQDATLHCGNIEIALPDLFSKL
jgi:hypothetical protein